MPQVPTGCLCAVFVGHQNSVSCWQVIHLPFQSSLAACSAISLMLMLLLSWTGSNVCQNCACTRARRGGSLLVNSHQRTDFLACCAQDLEAMAD